MKELWVEKYRPKTVDGYVFQDEAQRSTGKDMDKRQKLFHLLFRKCWHWKDDFSKTVVPTS